jgi:hypothetical protein
MTMSASPPSAERTQTTFSNVFGSTPSARAVAMAVNDRSCSWTWYSMPSDASQVSRLFMGPLDTFASIVVLLARCT